MEIIYRCFLTSIWVGKDADDCRSPGTYWTEGLVGCPLLCSCFIFPAGFLKDKRQRYVLGETNGVFVDRDREVVGVVKSYISHLK